QYFAKAADAERYQHRVTLFICEETTTPTGREKRLRIHARAGVHEDSQTAFAIDDSRRERCEGVAGQAWFLDTTVTEEALPAWPNDPEDLAGQDAYARGGLL